MARSRPDADLGQAVDSLGALSRGPVLGRAHRGPTRWRHPDRRAAGARKFTVREHRVTQCNLTVLASASGSRPSGADPASHWGATEVWRRELEMALLPGTLSRAGPLCSDILDLQVAEHGPDTRVVTAVGEIDALTAPELAAFVTAQLVIAQVVVVNLDGVRFLSSAGLRALFEVNELATREDRDLRLVCNSQTANWALEATGLRKHFTFTDNAPRGAGSRP